MSAEGAPATSFGFFGFQVMWLARFQRLVSCYIQYLGRCPRLVLAGPLALQSSSKNELRPPRRIMNARR
jgi:hypothetical protein